MKTQMLVAAFTALFAFRPLAIQCQPVQVGELVVSGVPLADSAWIESLLPFSKRSRFASLDEARKSMRLAVAYLGQSERFSGVDIEIEESEAGLVDIYVFPHPASIAGLSIFESKMTTIPNFPFYGVGSGFSIGGSEQLLGLDIPLTRGLSMDFVLGQSIPVEGNQALSARAGFNAKPLPLLSAYVMAGADRYLDSWTAPPLDVYAQAGGRLRLDFLSRIILFGPSLECSLRVGLLDFPYTAIRGKAAVLFEPADIFLAEAMVGIYTVSGEVPRLVMARSAATRDLRLPPVGLPDTGGLASASINAKLRLPIKLSLGFSSLSFAPLCFLEASMPFPGPGGISAAEGILHGSFSPTAGGGLAFAFSPPISVILEVGGGYSFVSRSAAIFMNAR